MSHDTHTADDKTEVGTPILAGRDVVMTFRRETGEVVRALDGVSVEIAGGTLAALVGPDGAGKTTLLRLSAGLMARTAASLTVLGLDVARRGRSRSRPASATCRSASACTRT